MNDKIYKALLGLCVGTALLGCAGVGYGLKKYHDTQQLEATKRKAKEVIEVVQNATIYLMGYDENNKPNGTGTGFIIQSDDQGSWIITNKHVCMMRRLSVDETKRSGGLFSFRPLGSLARYKEPQLVIVSRVAQNADLCLIRTSLKTKKPLKLAKKITQNEKMFTFGFPNSIPELNFGKYLRTELGFDGFYSITDAKIWYGASGSPAVNMNGEVIGVMSSIRYKEVPGKKKAQKREDVIESLFIPLETLREFIGGL